MITNDKATVDNVIPLPQAPAPAQKISGSRLRFRVVQFENPRTGSKSWRVTGTTRAGDQIRENFSDEKQAQCRQVELLAEYMGRQPEADHILRATKLSDSQLRLCEAALTKLDADDDLLPAIEHWLKHGKQNAIEESPRLHDAVEQFEQWLDVTESLRTRSKGFLRTQIGIFSNAVDNLRVCDFAPEHIESFLADRNVSAQTKINSRLAVSRFFNWCALRPRRWATVNPCTVVKVEKGKREALPEVLAVADCEKLLRAAEGYRDGKLVPYISACLFGGLRPAEAMRLTWDSVNLSDGEITIRSQASKTNTPRTVHIDGTLKAWLKAHKSKSFCPENLRKDLDAVKLIAGFGESKPWPQDVMRHTAISHYFRKSGSFGLSAEQFGNSEAVIRRHYKGRVSSEDTKAFYALRPRRK